jgi:hypothetical protein
VIANVRPEADVSTMAVARIFALCFLLLLSALGCRTETHVQTITIPDSNYRLDLVGPDEKQHYRYVIREKDQRVADSFLGPVRPLPRDKWTVTREIDGTYVIRYGEPEYAGRVQLDLERRMIVFDSNLANPRNRTFEGYSNP